MTVTTPCQPRLASSLPQNAKRSSPPGLPLLPGDSAQGIETSKGIPRSSQNRAQRSRSPKEPFSARSRIALWSSCHRRH
ncbi:MAG: hypothetical protein AAB576_00215, partial [Elusimicrobiota bacterium]